MRNKVYNYLNSFLLLSRMSKPTRNKVSYNFDEAVDHLFESDEEDLGQFEDDNDSDSSTDSEYNGDDNLQLQLMFSSLDLTRMPSEWNLLYRKRDQNVKETLVV